MKNINIFVFLIVMFIDSSSLQCMFRREPEKTREIQDLEHKLDQMIQLCKTHGEYLEKSDQKQPYEYSGLQFKETEPNIKGILKNTYESMIDMLRQNKHRLLFDSDTGKKVTQLHDALLQYIRILLEKNQIFYLKIMQAACVDAMDDLREKYPRLHIQLEGLWQLNGYPFAVYDELFPDSPYIVLGVSYNDSPKNIELAYTEKKAALETAGSDISAIEKAYKEFTDGIVVPSKFGFASFTKMPKPYLIDTLRIRLVLQTGDEILSALYYDNLFADLAAYRSTLEGGSKDIAALEEKLKSIMKALLTSENALLFRNKLAQAFELFIKTATEKNVSSVMAVIKKGIINAQLTAIKYMYPDLYGQLDMMPKSPQGSPLLNKLETLRQSLSTLRTKLSTLSGALQNLKTKLAGKG